MSQVRVGFMGAGQMATALARGFVSAGLLQPGNIAACDPVAAAANNFVAATGGRNRSAVEVVQESDVLFLAVKPQHMAEVLATLRGAVTSNHLVVSIAAGITLRALADGLGARPRLVRVMPNTPCLVGQGASGYCLGPGATEEDGGLVKRLLASVGTAVCVDESLLDAVTGLSGSGPAFVFLVVEALADGGVRMGLPRETAMLLAAQTVRGAAEMVLASGEHPAVLKDRVASPGGTTIAGLRALELAGVRGALMDAVEAATRRSQELGQRS